MEFARKSVALVGGIAKTSSAVALAAALSGPAVAATPSAKFAATWTETPALASVAEITGATMDNAVVDSRTGYTIATIKVPQDKELLVGVSAEVGLVTFGKVKGKNGGSGSSLADAEAYVTVFAVPHSSGLSSTAEPGQIMLTKRIQELDATLGGVIESCTDSNADGTIDVATECTVTDEEIGLLQNTTAAHHFNFVLPNMDQGVYDIKAVFTTGARAEVDICEACGGTVEVSSEAQAVINKTMVTVQQVRAAEGGVVADEIIEP